MSSKDSKECSHHKDKRKKFFRRCCAGCLIFNFIVLVIFLIVWAILQPTKPKFIIQDATIYNFNLTAPNLLNTNMQITVTSRNPNDKIGIYYDKLNIYATYHNQQITYYTSILPTYQGTNNVNVWSPFIYGTMIPVAPFIGVSLNQDLSGGAVSLLIKMDGRVRWKVGSFVTGGYGMHITCPAYIPFGNGNGNTGIIVGNAVKYQLAQSCSVSV